MRCGLIKSRLSYFWKMDTQNSDWKSNIKDWEKVSLDMYRFYFELAEKRSDAVIKISEDLTTKTFTIIGFVVPAVTVIFTIFIKKPVYHFAFWSGSGLLFLMSVAIVYALKNVLPYKGFLPGTKPENIVTENFANPPELKDEEILKALYLSELENLQDKITQNENQNQIRLSNYQMVINLTAISWMLIAITFYFI